MECDDIEANSENVTVTKNGLAYLSTIVYTCFEGHYYDDGASERVSVCNGTEQWTITEDQLCSRGSFPFNRLSYELHFGRMYV